MIHPTIRSQLGRDRVAEVARAVDEQIDVPARVRRSRPRLRRLRHWPRGAVPAQDTGASSLRNEQPT